MAAAIRPDRLLRHAYPDAALLARLTACRLAELAIPEHEILQFRRLQVGVSQLRLAGWDVQATPSEAFFGAALVAPVRDRLAVSRCEFDLEITDEVVARIAHNLPPGFLWLTSNASVTDPSVQALPLGLTDYCGYTPYHAVIGDSARFHQLIQAPRRADNLVLMNFRTDTWPQEREGVRALFTGKPFVTDATYAPDSEGYAAYVDGLRSHAFCLAPRGNGVDTHRLWESLYAGCIPIVRRHPAMRAFADLPILFVDEWADAADVSLLEAQLAEINARAFDLRGLSLSYWLARVQDLLNSSS